MHSTQPMARSTLPIVGCYFARKSISIICNSSVKILNNLGKEYRVVSGVECRIFRTTNKESNFTDFRNTFAGIGTDGGTRTEVLVQRDVLVLRKVKYRRFITSSTQLKLTNNKKQSNEYVNTKREKYSTQQILKVLIKINFNRTIF